MTSFASALVLGVLQKLKDDEAVALLVKKQIFDVVPGKFEGQPSAPLASVKPPWIYIGPLGAPRLECVGFRAWQPRLRFFAVTDSFKRDDAWAIVDAIDSTLDGQTIEMPDGFAMAEALRAVECGDLIDPTKPRAAFADFECVVTRTEPMFPDPL